MEEIYKHDELVTKPPKDMLVNESVSGQIDTLRSGHAAVAERCSLIGVPQIIRVYVPSEPLQRAVGAGR